MSGYVYLASPYTLRIGSPEQCLRTETRRYQQVCKHAGELMEAGLTVFCPISHSHGIGLEHEHVRKDHAFWMQQDKPWLVGADYLVVLMLIGWSQSRGVLEEIETWHSLGRAPHYWDPYSISAEQIARKIRCKDAAAEESTKRLAVQDT